MMICSSLPLLSVPKISLRSSVITDFGASLPSISVKNSSSTHYIPRCYDDNAGYRSTVTGMPNSFLKSLMVATTGPQRKRRSSTNYPTSIAAASDSPLFSGEGASDSPGVKFYQDVLEAAREKFTKEIQFKDEDISLAKALLYIAAEDEAFMGYKREMDARSLQIERSDDLIPAPPHEGDPLELMLLAGKSISEWLDELDAIAREVEAELVSRDIGCHLVEVIEAVNVILFDLRGFKRVPFKRVPIAVDPNCSYLHGVLSSGSGSAFIVSIIYIEVCQRLGITMVGSRVGEDFLIWPKTGNPEELFKVKSGHSLFAIINGTCVEDPNSMASDLDSNSLLSLDITSKKDIIGIALANLIRLHWKRASRSCPGLMLTSALRLVHDGGSSPPLLRPHDLRLAIRACERLLPLKPQNWLSMRDHGMMLYYSREYGKAIEALSVCMAFAPVEETAILESFVLKLHLIRLKSSWEYSGPSGLLTAL